MSLLEDADAALGQARLVSSDPRRLFDGVSFAFDVGYAQPALVGDGSGILFSSGEPTMIYGPQGVGKTTVAQSLIPPFVGIGDHWLGFPVRETERVIYIAADRPTQAAKSWRRTVERLDEPEREILTERVVFHKGAPPFDLGAEPEKLLSWVRDLDGTMVVVDSLKDVAMDLSKDEIGARVNRAWQECVAGGVEVIDLHHPRKVKGGDKRSKRPESLDDVYGSTWLTAGHGSVLALWGNPGDPIVEFAHLKQPEEEVGPFALLIDHERGTVSIHEGADPLVLVRGRHAPSTAADIARLAFSTDSPTRNDIEKMRRKLDKLVVKGLIARTEPGAIGESVRYRAGA